MPYCFEVTADIAGIGEAGDRAQSHLLAATGDHHRRTRFLNGLRFEYRILDIKIPAVERRPRAGSTSEG